MNKAIQRTNKLLKSIGHKNFFTKRNPVSILFSQGSNHLFQTTNKSFLNDDNNRGGVERYERFQNKGNHNIRLNFASEKLINLVQFIEKNHKSFDREDYIECFHQISNKLDRDNVYNNITKKAGIKILNDYLKENFEELKTSSGIIILQYLALMSTKESLSVSMKQKQDLVNEQLSQLQNDHLNMQLKDVLNKITILGLLTNSMSVIGFLRGREDELQTINYPFLLKYMSRCQFKSQSNVVRAFVVRFISQECIKRAEDERIFNRIRLLNCLCTINIIDPLLNLNLKIKSIVDNLKNDFDSFEPFVINQFIEAISNWDDIEKPKIIRELCDNFIVAINNRDSGLRKITALNFIENLSKIRLDGIVTPEHLMVLLDFFLEEGDELKYSKNFINIFTIFKKIKFNDVNYIEKCFDTTFANLKFYAMDENLINFKNIVKQYLPKEYMEKIHNRLEENTNELLEDKYPKPVIALNNLSRITLFECKEEVIEQNVQMIIDIVNKNYSISILITLVRSYVSTAQKFLAAKYRDLIVKEILNKVSSKENGNIKLFILFSEFKISKTNEELKNKLNEVLENISNDDNFQKGYFRSFEQETEGKDREITLTNLSFSRYVQLTRKFIKEKNFLLGKERFFILNIIQTVYNLLKNKSENRIGDDLILSLFRLAEEVITNKPEFLPNLQVKKLSNYIRTFNTANIDSVFIEKLVINSLNSFNLDNQKSANFSLDLISLFDKISPKDVNDEKINCIKRYFKNEENIRSLFSTSYSDKMFTLYCRFNSMDRTIIPDDIIFWAKEIIIKKLESSVNKITKFSLLFALANMNKKFLNNGDIKRINIETIFSDYPLYKIVNNINQIPLQIKKGSLSYAIFNEISKRYQKEEPNKFITLRLFDKFTSVRWNHIGFFNKFISDYSEISGTFSPGDHMQILNFMTRNGFKHNEIIEHSIGIIKNYTRMSDNDRFNLINALIKLGMYKNSIIGKEFITDLLKNEDLGFALKRNLSEKIERIFDLNKLRKDFEVKEMIDALIQRVNKVFEEEKKEIIMKNLNKSLAYFLLKSDISEKFNENLKKFIVESYFKQRERDFKGNMAVNLVRNCLTAMKNTFEVFSESNLYDIYFPEEKIGLIFVKSNQINIINLEPKEDYISVKEELQTKGDKVILFDVNQIHKKHSENGNNKEKFVEYLETEIKLPNKNVEKVYNFSKEADKPKEEEEEEDINEADKPKVEEDIQ